MISVFLQNLAVILASLLILANHRADYTLYIAVAAIIVTSIRLAFSGGDPGNKITVFLVQSFIFALFMWYILFPQHFRALLGAF